jgi:plastocyanin
MGFRVIAPLWMALALATSVALAQPAPGPTPSMPPTTMPTAPPSSAASPAPQPSPALVVHMKDFAYSPKDAVVKVGDTIQFVNDDESAHTVTADDKSYDSGYMAKGQTWSKTYAKAGVYPYFCAYHAFMRATLTVK